MHSQPEISDIAAESDDGVPRRASHSKKEDVPGAICSVVGAAESHLAIVLAGFLLSTNLNAVCRQPRRTISGQSHVRAKFSARTGWQRSKGQRSVCSARLYEAKPGRNGAFVEAPTLYWPVVLNVCGLQ